MATIIKNWSEGGGQLTITYNGKGNDTIILSSTANTLPRERTLTFSVVSIDNKITKTFAVTQSAAAKDYIDSNGVWHIANGSVSGSTLTLTDYTHDNGTTKYKY